MAIKSFNLEVIIDTDQERSVVVIPKTMLSFVGSDMAHKLLRQVVNGAHSESNGKQVMRTDISTWLVQCETCGEKTFFTKPCKCSCK